MLSIGVSEFRANMNVILKQVQDGKIVSLLVRGREVAKLVPPDFAQITARQELETLRQDAIVGDVVTPVDEQWHGKDQTW